MKDSGHTIVTGGAGFIGSHLVERLLAEGKRVVVIDDCSTGRRENLAAVETNPSLRFLPVKISDCAQLDTLMSEAAATYHLAAAVGVEMVLKNPVQTLRTNLHETSVILEKASQHGVSFMLTSTSEVYGKSAKPCLSEDDDLVIGPPPYQRWCYACSKLTDEFLALAYAQERGLPIRIARLFNTVGPRQTGQYGMVLPRFIAAAKSGQPLRVFGDGRQTRCFCHVDDTVEALVRLQGSRAGQGEIVNVGATEEISIRELAELVIEVVGSTSKIELVPYDEAYGPGFEDMLQRRPNVSKLEAITGFRATWALREIIARTADNDG